MEVGECTGGGAFSDGKPIHVSLNDKLERSLLVTGFGYEHDEAWSANLELFKHFTDTTRGVRRLGAAAVVRPATFCDDNKLIVSSKV